MLAYVGRIVCNLRFSWTYFVLWHFWLVNSRKMTFHLFGR